MPIAKELANDYRTNWNGKKPLKVEQVQTISGVMNLTRLMPSMEGIMT
jgi:hypothetical protein